MEEIQHTQEGDIKDTRLLDKLTEMEKKLDELIITKRLEMQQWLSVPSRYNCKIRVSVSPFFHLPTGYILPNFHLPVQREDLINFTNIATLELKIEGKVVEICPVSVGIPQPNMDLSKINRRFMSFFKSIFVELDPSVYGKDLRLVEWSRTKKNIDSDGFIVKRAVLCTGDFNTTIVFTPYFNPQQYNLSAELGSILGIKSQTKAFIINSLWKYITLNNLLDSYHRDLVHSNEVLHRVFNCEQFMLCDISEMLIPHLHPVEPHVISCNIKNPLKDAMTYSAGCLSSQSQIFDINLEVNDVTKDLTHSYVIHFNNKVLSMDLNELQSLEQQAKQIGEQLINMRTKMKDYQEYANDPSNFINKWLKIQCSDYHFNASSQNDPRSNASTEEKRTCEYYCKPWTQEFVHRYIFSFIQNKSIELNKALNVE